MLPSAYITQSHAQTHAVLVVHLEYSRPEARVAPEPPMPAMSIDLWRAELKDDVASNDGSDLTWEPRHVVHTGPLTPDSEPLALSLLDFYVDADCRDVPIVFSAGELLACLPREVVEAQKSKDLKKRKRGRFDKPEPTAKRPQLERAESEQVETNSSV